MAAESVNPHLQPLARVVCDVGEIVSLGEAAHGERRVVPLGGGTVRGPRLNGRIVEGGADWQWRRADGVLEVSAHYVIEAEDGGLIEVRSEGLRHGPPDVMSALQRGEDVPASAYFFRTFVRFTTGAPAWLHLNRTMAVAVGRREARRVVLELFELA
jgi:hypothetical protein